MTSATSVQPSRYQNSRQPVFNPLTCKELYDRISAAYKSAIQELIDSGKLAEPKQSDTVGGMSLTLTFLRLEFNPETNHLKVYFGDFNPKTNYGMPMEYLHSNVLMHADQPLISIHELLGQLVVTECLGSDAQYVPMIMNALQDETFSTQVELPVKSTTAHLFDIYFLIDLFLNQTKNQAPVH